MTERHILIIGCGSVGKRHAKNLLELGCSVTGVDPRKDRVEEFMDTMNTKNGFLSLEKALQSELLFHGAVVASPTKYHVEQAMKLVKLRIPVLLEKPVSIDLASAKTLMEATNNSNTPILLGYTWRWWEPLSKVREMIEQSTIGKIRHAHFMMSAHLEDWHPWEPLKDFFMASKDQGGGALLDESHWLDLAYLFFGMPTSLFAQVEKISDLDIDSDDNVDILMYYQDGLRVSIHLDLYGRPHEKYIRFIGDTGTIIWSAEPNQIAIYKNNTQSWEYNKFDHERNDMFVAVAKEFIEIINGSKPKTCTLEEGIHVMKIIESIRESSQSKNMIKIG